MKTTTHAIDATGKSLGRIASEAAKALMGKMSAEYTAHIRSDVKVVISNAGKLHMPERKRAVKKYTTYSGYPGGLKHDSFNTLAARRGVGEAIRHAVRGMMPRNTMLVARMKNLTITD